MKIEKLKCNSCGSPLLSLYNLYLPIDGFFYNDGCIERKKYNYPGEIDLDMLAVCENCRNQWILKDISSIKKLKKKYIVKNEQ